MADGSCETRKGWKVGSQCSIYSKSRNEWSQGKIVKTYKENEEEWLSIEYKNRIKDVKRYDTQIIAPLQINSAPPHNTSNHNHNVKPEFNSPMNMTTNNNNKKRNRKRRLELDDSPIETQPPTKKLKTSNHNNHNNIKIKNIQWNNTIVLNKKCIDMLNQIIEQHLSIRKHGFGLLNDSLYNTIIKEHINKLQTENGLLLTEIPNIILLLKGFRSTKVMNKQLSCSKRIPKVLHSNDFKKYFDINKPNKLYDESDTNQWLNICTLNGIPPFMLLQNWLKTNKVFKKNKDIKNMVKKTGNIKFRNNFAIVNNESFRKFCIQISENDTSCFQFELMRQNNSVNFEELMYNKLANLISENSLDAVMVTETEQRNNNSKNKKYGLTPDILFTKPIVINNRKCYWIDMKNYFLRKGFLWKKTNKTIGKYTNAFGNGAVICRGFECSLQKSANCLLLDAFCDR